MPDDEFQGFDFSNLPPVGAPNEHGDPPSAEPGLVHEPYRDFEFDLQTNRLRCAGYSTDEVAELLRLYREHMRLMNEFAIAAGQAMREAGV